MLFSKNSTQVLWCICFKCFQNKQDICISILEYWIHVVSFDLCCSYVTIIKISLFLRVYVEFSCWQQCTKFKTSPKRYNSRSILHFCIQNQNIGRTKNNTQNLKEKNYWTEIKFHKINSMSDHIETYWLDLISV